MKHEMKENTTVKTAVYKMIRWLLLYQYILLITSYHYTTSSRQPVHRRTPRVNYPKSTAYSSHNCSISTIQYDALYALYTSCGGASWNWNTHANRSITDDDKFDDDDNKDDDIYVIGIDDADDISIITADDIYHTDNTDDIDNVDIINSVYNVIRRVRNIGRANRVDDVDSVGYFDNADDTLSIWTFPNSLSAPCTDRWEGLTCVSVVGTNLCEITEISLDTMGLQGALPTELGNIESLRKFEVSTNNLTSSIPSELGKLSNLEIIVLAENFLSQAIPFEVFAMSTLTTLDFSYNRLEGTAPSSLAYLINLQKCYLEFNLFSSTLPTELGTMTALQLLSFGHSNVEGSIPSEYGQLNGLQGLYLYESVLTGTLPAEIGNCTQITDLWIEENNLSGPIPASFSNLSYIRNMLVGNNLLTGEFSEGLCYSTNDWNTISINNNYITGSLPGCLGINNVGLITLVASANYFSGSVPLTFEAISALEQFDIGLNMLTGSIPAYLLQLPSITELLVNNNAFDGLLPSEFGDVTRLYSFDASNTYVTGSIPTALTKASYLRLLNLYSTYLTGTISTQLIRLPLLEILYLNDNYLSGTLPSIDLRRGIMAYISAQDNYLSGTFPVEILHSFIMLNVEFSDNYFLGPNPLQLQIGPKINYLAFNNNIFSGVVPRNWSSTNVSLVEYIYGDYNQLTGSLPYDLLIPQERNGSVVRSLVHFSFTANLLTGLIPPALGYHSNLKLLSLSNNQLTGSLPTELRQLQQLINLNMSNNNLLGRVSAMFSDEDGGESTSMYSIFPNITYIILSQNAFTGTLPASLFLSRQLQVISLNSNCFSGSIPTSICYSSSLQSVAMNSITTGKSCRTHLPGFTTAILKAVFPLKKLKGSIPSCIWSLNTLATLQLSGNKLTGSLPADMTLSSSLVNLELGYNVLTGSIPAAIQHHGMFSYLSLQNNKLSGTLLPTFSVNNVTIDGLQFSLDTSASMTLNLQVNRLSGNIPSSVTTLVDIDILADNLFECVSYHSLPSHDPSSNSYSCGSSGFSTSLYVWLSVACLIVAACCALLTTMKYISTYSSEHSKSRIAAILANSSGSEEMSRGIPSVNETSTVVPGVRNISFCRADDPTNKFSNLEYVHAVIFSAFVNSFYWVSFPTIVFSVGKRAEDKVPVYLRCRCSVYQYLELLTLVRRGVIRLAIIYLVIMMSIYVLLKSKPNIFNSSGSESGSDNGGNYSTHELQYAWITTSAFMHGWLPPACVMITLFSSLVGATYHGMKFRLDDATGPMVTDDKITSGTTRSAGAQEIPLQDLSVRMTPPFLLTSPPSSSCSLPLVASETQHEAVEDGNIVKDGSTPNNRVVPSHNLGVEGDGPELVTSQRLYSVSFTSQTDARVLHELLSTEKASRSPIRLFVREINRLADIISKCYATYGGPTNWKYGSLLVPSLIQLVNVIATVTGNIIYVTLLQSKNITHNQALVLPLFISIFKAAWAHFYVTWAMQVMSCLTSKVRMYHEIILFLAILLAAPILSTVYADQSCLYRAFVSAPSILSVYSDNEVIQTCSETLLYNVEEDGYIHAEIVSSCELIVTTQQISSSSVPPYIYSYQCGSAIMTNFIPVLLYSYIFSLLLPLSRFIALHVPLSYFQMHHWLYAAIIRGTLLDSEITHLIPVHTVATQNPMQNNPSCDVLPDNSRATVATSTTRVPVVPLTNTLSSFINVKFSGADGAELCTTHTTTLMTTSVPRNFFDGSIVVARRFLDFAILLTFGLACPLLGLTVMFNVSVNTFVWRMMIGKYLVFHDRNRALLDSEDDSTPNKLTNAAMERLERCTKGIMDGIVGTMAIVLCVVCMFWSIMVFDMVADVYGDVKGYILAGTTAFGFPCLAYILSYTLHRCFAVTHTQSETAEVDNILSAIGTSDAPEDGQREWSASFDSQNSEFV
jgi:Leucine-rich repeat (LRR) protein